MVVWNISTREIIYNDWKIEMILRERKPRVLITILYIFFIHFVVVVAVMLSSVSSGCSSLFSFYSSICKKRKREWFSSNNLIKFYLIRRSRCLLPLSLFIYFYSMNFNSQKINKIKLNLPCNIFGNIDFPSYFSFSFIIFLFFCLFVIVVVIFLLHWISSYLLYI